MNQDAQEQYDDAKQRISKDDPSEKSKWQNLIIGEMKV